MHRADSVVSDPSHKEGVGLVDSVCGCAKLSVVLEFIQLQTLLEIDSTLFGDSLGLCHDRPALSHGK